VKQVNGLKCALTFSFDTSAPCRVSVFVNARDDHGKIITSEKPLAVLSYGAGLNQQFPAPGSDPVLVDLDSITAGDWGGKTTLQKYQPFPLVIRMEALDTASSNSGTSSSSPSAQTLEAIDVGGVLPAWVCAQTTFAKMQRTHPDGAVPVTQDVWKAHHVMQKIWIRGQNYELQEIYGMESGKPAGDVVEGIEAGEVRES
jgi:E3 ubiquitin-protein ligase MGRN1